MVPNGQQCHPEPQEEGSTPRRCLGLAVLCPRSSGPGLCLPQHQTGPGWSTGLQGYGPLAGTYVGLWGSWLFFQFLFSKTEEDPTWVPSLPVLSSWTPSPGSLSLTEGPGQVCPVGHTKPPYSPWVGGIVEHQG